MTLIFISCSKGQKKHKWVLGPCQYWLTVSQNAVILSLPACNWVPDMEPTIKSTMSHAWEIIINYQVARKKDFFKAKRLLPMEAVKNLSSRKHILK